MTKVFAAAVLMGTLLTACGPAGPNATNQTADAPVAAPTPAAGVTRDVVETEDAPVQPITPATAIQSQPGPDGSQLDLLKVAVTGDILTVTLRCSSGERINSESFRVPDISVIDDATAQRISVLKDNEDKWMASNVSGDRIGVACEQKPGILWAKFPAPPATSKTVSINLPQVAPFDGVPVTR